MIRSIPTYDNFPNKKQKKSSDTTCLTLNERFSKHKYNDLNYEEVHDHSKQVKHFHSDKAGLSEVVLKNQNFKELRAININVSNVKHNENVSNIDRINRFQTKSVEILINEIDKHRKRRPIISLGRKIETKYRNNVCYEGNPIVDEIVKSPLTKDFNPYQSEIKKTNVASNAKGCTWLQAASAVENETVPLPKRNRKPRSAR